MINLKNLAGTSESVEGIGQAKEMKKTSLSTNVRNVEKNKLPNIKSKSIDKKNEHSLKRELNTYLGTALGASVVSYFSGFQVPSLFFAPNSIGASILTGLVMAGLVLMIRGVINALNSVIQGD
jgi:hypothetical protein